jgi:murein DD-endopeptidase MepM/ murein hydrolase activator NlpD
MALNFPDLGIDWGKARQELHADLGDVWGKVNSAATNTLGRVADAGQGAGSTLGRIAQAGAGGGNQLARIAQAGGRGGSGLERIAQVGYDGDSLGRIAGYGNYGGGNTLDFFSTLPDADPFANLNASLARSAAQQPATPATPGAGGVGATGADPSTDQWRTQIDEAAARVSQDSGVAIDGDALQAIMMIESGGDARATSGAGARGLNQVMPFHTDNPNYRQYGTDLYDPQTNLYYSAAILADNYKRWGDWDKAVAAYLGAIDANGNIAGGDPYTGVSGNQYVAMFNQNLQRIKSARAQRAGATGSMAGVTPGYAGGSIMQEFGPTEYAKNHPETYAYGNAYGLPGSQHPGVDWAVPLGTQVATPLGGTVYVVGNDHGSGYYYTNTMSQSDPDHSGEFAVMLDNGDVLILGHLSGINVQVGQKVTAGQLIGLSGGSDGAHIHVEYRQRQGDGSYRIIDPRTVLR